MKPFLLVLAQNHFSVTGRVKRLGWGSLLAILHCTNWSSHVCFISRSYPYLIFPLRAHLNITQTEGLIDNLKVHPDEVEHDLGVYQLLFAVCKFSTFVSPPALAKKKGYRHRCTC